MIRCEQVRARLSAFLDRRLDAEATRALSLHMARCEDCAAERDGLERLTEVAAHLPLVSPLPHLADRARVAATRTSLPRSAHLALAAALIMTFGLGVAVAYRLGHRHGSATRGSGVATTRFAQSPPLQVEDPPAVVDVNEDGVPGYLRPSRDPRELPSDAQALRAARSVFADLELLDRVPQELHEPLLRPQVERHDLARWAREREQDPEFADLATLVQELEAQLANGLAPNELAHLRERASTQAVWANLAHAVASSAAPGMDDLLDEHVALLPDATRASVGEWIRFKDDWLHGGEDVGVLIDLIEGLGPSIDTDVGAVFTFPDLDGLMDDLEWTEAADGSRRGVLDLSEEGPGSSSRVRIEVHTSSSSSRR